MIDESHRPDVDALGAESQLARPTRWDTAKAAGADDEPAVESSGERSGLYLALLALFLLPMLIIAAFALSSRPSESLNRVEQSSINPSPGLGELVIDQRADPTSDRPTPTLDPSVAGIIEEAPAPIDDLGNEDAARDSQDAEPPSDSPAAVIDRTSDDSGETTAAATPVPEENAAGNTATPSAAPAVVEVPVVDPDDAANVAVVEPAPTAPARPTTTTPATTTTTAPTTTEAAAQEEPVEEVAPPVEVAAFTQRIDIGQLGDTFVRFRFASSTTTSYRAVILDAGSVVATSRGTAIANELVNESIDGLTPGRDYSVQVFLNGPPSVSSSPVAVRTSGGEPEPVAQQVTLQNLRLVDNQATRFEVHYESNVCANGSFVIREQGRGAVGSNNGQREGCTTRHLGIPGFWTAALKPNTTYVITVTVEANGNGLGGGNTATQSLTITTTD